jgi:hypothetical protein
MECSLIDKGGYRMEGLKEKLNPIVFGVAALCFLLPFFKLSCGDMEFASLTGLQMVTGTQIETPQMGEGMTLEGAEGTGTMEQELNFEGSPFALAALVACVLGFFFGFANSNFSRGLRAVLGAVGAVALIALKVGIDGDVTSKGEGIVKASAGFGWWGAVALMCAAFIFNLYREKRESRYSKFENVRPARVIDSKPPVQQEVPEKTSDFV